MEWMKGEWDGYIDINIAKWSGYIDLMGVLGM